MLVDNTQNGSDFLEHYGKKGMKWGVTRSKKSKKLASDYKKTVPLRQRDTKELSNKQIKTVNERINLEQNYSRLNPGKINQGRKVATEVLATVGIGVAAYNVVKSPAGKALLNIGKKAAYEQLKLF